MASAATASRRAAAADMRWPSRRWILRDVGAAFRLDDLRIARRVAAAASGAAAHVKLSRDLLMRGITYKLQERPLGGLSKSILRKLERRTSTWRQAMRKSLAPPISLKAGTRLVREWRGVTYPTSAMKNGATPKRPAC